MKMHYNNKTYRNLHIYYAAILGCKKLNELAIEYNISAPCVKTIILREARQRAPKLYHEITSLRFPNYRKKDFVNGPTIFELRQFKDIFLYGDI